MVKQTIQIFARVKPAEKNRAVYSVNEDEPGESSLEFVVPRDLADGFVNNKRESYKFRFQKVFDEGCKQEDIFERVAKPVADSVLAGYNGTIFAYGQTGSGKTFTITGGAERYNDRGIIPRTLSYIYQNFSQDKSKAYTIHISYLEIYNEVGYDLLDPRHETPQLEDLPRVTIMEDTDQIIHLKNLSIQPSASEEEALNLLFLGDTNRMIAETPMNQASTRSHCIFTIHLCSREHGSATLRRSKLHLVDLAGSERVGKTGVGGQLLTEAKYINLSLHYLEQVIIALSEKNRSHIPYRNSMMTSVLRDSLGGNCMTTMIGNLSVEKSNVDESISTCRFAQRVALIKNEAQLNEELDPALVIKRLKKEIESLKEELALVTGEQRKDDLTEEEIHNLEEQVRTFLSDSDPDAVLDLGPNMQKIHHCFSLLKVMLQDLSSSRTGNGDCFIRPVSREVETEGTSPHAELKKLQDMLQQRDNEISILVSMLKKEKKRAQDSASQLAQMSQSQSSLQSSVSVSEESCDPDVITNSSYTSCILHRAKGPELSMGRQEAFEVFRRDHEDSVTIEDNKVLLKHRFSEARGLGEQVNSARSRINELKKHLEQKRMQRAAYGVLENSAVPEMDDEEVRLCKQIEEEKKSYKSLFGRLKGLKTEIEHLQLLLEKKRVKLQQDFKEWWVQEEMRLQPIPCSLQQESESAGTNPRAGTRSQNLKASLPTGTSVSLSSMASRFPEPENTPLSTSDLRNFTRSHSHSVREGTHFSEMRALDPASISSSSIPLTGDQQTDADILAFVKARQNLLARTTQT